MRRIKQALVALVLMLPATAAFGQSQSIRQSGSVTARHGACWTTNGVIQDCGTAAIPFLSSIGTVGQGPTICANSAPSTGPYNQLCLSANTSSAAQIVLQNYGGAAAQGIEFNINGTVSTLPSISGATVAGNLASFLNSAGVLQDSGVSVTSVTGLGTMAKQNANAVAITGGSITGMPTPTLSADVAIKSYVDALAQGLNILASSTLATAAVLPNSPTYSNGTLGVGATLTAGSNTTLTVDGDSAPLNTIVLVKNQAAPAQNGIYKVTQAGDGSNPWILTRATYFDQAAEMKAGSYTLVTSGSTNTNSSWVLQATVTTVGTDAVNFGQFSAGSLSPGGTSGSFQFNNGGMFGGYSIGQLPGTSTNDSASTGNIGEYVSSFLAPGSAVALSQTRRNMVSISLTAGDWDVDGTLVLNNITGTGAIADLIASISTTSAVEISIGHSGRADWSSNSIPANSLANDAITAVTGPLRVSLAAPATVYFVVAMTTVGPADATGFGEMRARRVR